MRLALDATYSLGHNLTGVGIYSREILHGVAAEEASRAVDYLYRPHRFLRSFREAVPANARRRPLFDTFGPRNRLFHGLNQRLPGKRFRRQIATFHDLFVMTAEYSTPEFRARFTEQAMHAAAEADVIIAVSQFTADQVCHLLNVPAARVRVVHHGVSAVQKLDEPREKVVLHVGAVQKRKNLVRLVQAFEALPAPWRLVLAGGPGFGAEEVFAAVEQSPARERIEVTGYLADAEIGRWYARASIFAFPSLDEGFGMPVLEAMANGVPVIASNRGALPEVCGGAAVLVDAFDVGELSAQLFNLADNPEKRMQFIAAGRTHAADFTWAKAVARTIEIYRSLDPTI